MLAIVALLCFADAPVTIQADQITVVLPATLQKSLQYEPAEAIAKHAQVTLAGGTGTAILGQWEFKDKLVFKPKYPFQEAVEYRVLIGQWIDVKVQLPAVQRPATALTAVYPLGDQLPANTLRFYLHSSAPMQEGQGYAHFQLLDGTGQPIPRPFLELDEELWDARSQRFTLLLDPGRVKQELKPREELGPVLEAGKKYTLVIRPTWKDNHSKPLAAEVRKTFTAGPAIETGMDPATWALKLPKAGTTTAIQLDFGRPIDRELKHRLLRIESATGAAIAGEFVETQSDALWQFRPIAPWSAGNYQLIVPDELEDICGNRIGAAFDARLGAIGARARKAATRVPFTLP
jgi:hypothetical protein